MVRRKIIFLATLVVFSLLGIPSIYAQSKVLELAPIFSDHMVLQQAKKIPVWGTSSPNARVTVKCFEQTQTTIANKAGKWQLSLNPLKASFVPGKLMVSSDGQSITLQDVLVGEVWLCSGQSNMVMALGSITDPFFGVDSGKEEIAAPVINGIRLYNDNHLYDQHLKLHVWQIADSGAKAPFSAVAWFFGKKLRRQLNVPVGIINISAGGSPIQEWMTPASANADSLISVYKHIYVEHKAEIEDYAKKAFEYWKYSCADKTLKPPAALPQDVMLAGRFGKPGALFTSMLTPVIPFAVRGFIWYQGEANADYTADANDYHNLLKTMVTDWRNHWNDLSLPFYLVQLPCWNHGAIWPLLKLRQQQAAQSIANAGLVVTADICDSTNLHPKQKQPVGERLASLALAKTYHKKTIYAGPEIRDIKTKTGAVILTFNTNAFSDKLITRKYWDNVEIAGENGIYYPAKASLVNNVATVSNENVKQPHYIRYGWKEMYTPSLFNVAGLPAPAFYYAIKNNGFSIPESSEIEITGLGAKLK